jgi:hypothetical protein
LKRVDELDRRVAPNHYYFDEDDDEARFGVDTYSFGQVVKAFLRSNKAMEVIFVRDENGTNARNFAETMCSIEKRQLLADGIGTVLDAKSQKKRTRSGRRKE